MPQVRILGIDIEYCDDDFRNPWDKEGGIPILMVHGCAENASVWIPWVPGLSKKYRVLRYSMRGCGNSSMPADKSYDAWSGERIVNELRGLLDALNIQSVHFICYGSGGSYAQLFALTYPTRTSSLTLMQSPSKIPDETARRYAIDKKDWPTAMIEYGFPEWSRRTLECRIDTEVGDPRIKEWYHRQKSGGPAFVGAAVCAFINSMDLRPRLKDIKCPVLILSGDRSPITPVEHLHIQAREIPNAKLIIFENLGSGCPWLMTDRCVEEVLKFYESIG